MYEILQHTADVRFRVTAATLEELFREAVDGLMEAMKPLTRGEGTPPETLTIDAGDLTSLLVDFLGEILLRCHVRRQSYELARISLSGTSLTATLRAHAVEGFAEDVKAVTYHEADVRRVDGDWTTMLVLDV